MSDHPDLPRDPEFDQVKTAVSSILDLAPPIPATPPRTPESEGDQPGKLRLLTAAAVLIAVVVGAGLLVNSRRRDGGTVQTTETASRPVSTFDTSPVSSAPTAGSGTTTPETSVEPGRPTDPTSFLIPTALPDGYVLTNLAAYPPTPVDPATTTTTTTTTGLVEYGPPLRSSALVVNPDRFGRGAIIMQAFAIGDRQITLASLAADSPGAEGQTIGGIERLVYPGGPTGDGDEFDDAASVTWIEDGQWVTLSGSAPVDDQVEVAAGISGLTLDEAIDRGRAITGTAQALPVIDRLAFDDGLEVSVRAFSTEETGGGAVAMCIEAPTITCSFGVLDALSGVYQNNLARTFVTDDETIRIAWQDAAEAERRGVPRLGASEAIPDASGDLVTEPSEIVADVNTDVGRFIRVHVPPGKQPPRIDYPDCNCDTAGWGQAPLAPGPTEF